MAKSLRARITLLHVVEPVDEPDSDDPDTQQFYEDLRERAESKFAQQLAGVEAQAIETAVRVGPRHDTLIKTADEIGAELIILGSQPISFESMRLSVSHRVALTSHRPVLLVPLNN